MDMVKSDVRMTLNTEDPVKLRNNFMLINRFVRQSSAERSKELLLRYQIESIKNGKEERAFDLVKVIEAVILEHLNIQQSELVKNQINQQNEINKTL